MTPPKSKGLHVLDEWLPSEMPMAFYAASEEKTVVDVEPSDMTPMEELLFEDELSCDDFLLPIRGEHVGDTRDENDQQPIFLPKN